MSLLEPFTKPRWQHANAEIRRAAVEELEDPATLEEVARNDPDLGVRASALDRLDDADRLDGLIQNPPESWPPELCGQARHKRLQQLLGGGGSLPDDADRPVLVRVAELTEDPELCSEAIGRIRDAASCMDLARHHPQAKIRLQAARNIDDIDSLQALMQHAKHKDKAVFQHCREQIDKHLAERRAAEQLAQDLEQLAADAASLRSAVDSPDYGVRYQVLQKRWDEIAAQADPDQRGRIQGDMDICAERVGQKAAEEAAEQHEQALTAEAKASFDEMLAELQALDPAALAASEYPADLEAQLNSIEERWVAALQHAQPEDGQTEACKTFLNDWRVALLTLKRLSGREADLNRFFESAGHLDAADFKAVQKMQRRASGLAGEFQWPETLDSARPAVLGSLDEQNSRLEQRLSELKEKTAKVREKLDAAFETFRGELATNHFRNADRALNRLRNLLRQLPPARQESYQHDLQPLLARLREIHDWQGFAIEPKKEELIEQMKALAVVGGDVDDLAAKIKALQKEWKRLGPLSPKRDQELWQAFSTAADEAWAPCSEVFEQRAAGRKENYRQRMALVTQLIEYEKKIAWPDLDDPDPELPAPDWKMVRKTLHTARTSFSAIAPVDRKQERKSHKALDKVCSRIFGHLEKEYGRNIDAKKALVTEARTLADLDDLRQAIDRAKAIQRDWKDIGLTPQRVDRGLWKDLRKACDAVFARLGEEREQRNADARARHEQRRADERARAERAAEHKRQKRERWQRLLDRMQACALKAEDPEGATALWGEEVKLPKGIDGEALEAWWQDGSAAKQEDACREACIALEVLAERESPPEDKEARMAYQMKRLVEGMGSGQGDTRQRLLEEINAFIALRPSAEWVGRYRSGVEAAAKLEKSP
jgi:exonuclease SbcC